MRGSIRLSGGESPLAFVAMLARSRSIKDLRRAVMMSFPLPGLPLRIRPAFVVMCMLSLIVLSLLGFHPTLARRVQPPIPFSDKLLHFVCFSLATALFYAVWYVEPDARVLQPWRYWPEYASIGVCMVAGGFGSEFVQALLPYKEFQWLDVLANLMGSALGVYAARRITIQHRKKKEIRRLYDPIDDDGLLDDEDGLGSEEDDEEAHAGNTATSRRANRLDVWNAEDADSLFELGGDTDFDDDRPPLATHQRSRT